MAFSSCFFVAAEHHPWVRAATASQFLQTLYSAARFGPRYGTGNAGNGHLE